MNPLHPGHRFAIAACALGSLALAACGDDGPTVPADRTLEVEMKVVAITVLQSCDGPNEYAFLGTGGSSDIEYRVSARLPNGTTLLLAGSTDYPTGLGWHAHPTESLSDFEPIVFVATVPPGENRVILVSFEATEWDRFAPQGTQYKDPRLVAAERQLGLNGNADFDPGEHDIDIGGDGCRLRATISVAAKERS